MITQPISQQQPQQQGQQGQAGQSQGLTPTDLAAAVAAAIKQTMPAQQQPTQQQRQMSQQEIDQMLGTYNPDISLVEALFGAAATPEGRLAALGQLVQGVVANATGHAKYLTEDYIRRYHEHISDPLEDAKYASNERFFDSIYQGHEGLKPFDGLLRQMLPSMAQEKDYPTDRGERAKYVREKFLPHIKAIQPDFDPTRPAPVQSHQQGRHLNSPPQQLSGQPQQRQQGAGLPSLGGGGSGATVGASAPANGNRPSWDTHGHGF